MLFAFVLGNLYFRKTLCTILGFFALFHKYHQQVLDLLFSSGCIYLQCVNVVHTSCVDSTFVPNVYQLEVGLAQTKVTKVGCTD